MISVWWAVEAFFAGAIFGLLIAAIIMANRDDEE